MKVRTIAMYLPQFHRVKENDEWWGEGYTDWIAAKQTKQLFEGHYQPREPLNDNYYDLLDKSTMEWQADLMQQYGVDGLCFYHYYFKDGRKILEKPAENLLQWKEIHMPFCFCWDNTSWARTWSKLASKVSWADKYESNRDTKDDGILLEQKYGREKQWKEHFDYLLPFFQDERYIKIDGKPVFLFYRPQQIVCLAEMSRYWNQLAKESGFPGVYLIGTNIIKEKKGLDALLINGPVMYWRSDFYGKDIKPDFQNEVRFFEYNKLWKNVLETKAMTNIKTYYGGFVDYDDTPRRGKNGTFIKGVSAAQFRDYWHQLVCKNIEAGNELVFLNAFNEWGEGNYLEPDKERGHAFLEAIASVKKQIETENIERNTDTLSATQQKTEEELAEELLKMKVEKFKNYFQLLNRWLELKEKGLSLSAYFLERDYKQIAIYGLGIMGNHLCTELENSEVKIAYAIDKKAISHPELEVKSLQEELPQVDAVVVTATFEFDEIWENIRNKFTCPIVSLEEVLEEV